MEASQVVRVVDDNPGMRSALHRIVSSAGWRVETYESARDFLDRYDPRVSGCILLDVRMPGMSGLDLQRELRGTRPHLPIIFITGHADVSAIVHGMKSGAVDFLEKPFSSQQLLGAIDEAVARDTKTRREHARVMGARVRLRRLTDREREAGRLVAAGRRNKQIAAELGISTRTVEVHRHHLMRKLDAESVPDVVRIFIDAESAP